MSAILTGGNKCAIYRLLQIGAIYFILTILMACAKVPTPVEPEEIDDINDVIAEQFTPVASEPFNLTIDIANFPVRTSLPNAVTGIRLAKLRWESAISEGLPDVNSPIYGPIDDLLISIFWANSNHEFQGVVGSVLASAGPRMARVDSPGLPYYGIINVYPVMNDTSYTVKDWTGIMTHEIGHILGFTDHYINKVGTEDILGVRYFNGRSAAEAYRFLLYYGLGEKLAYGIPDFRVPMENDYAHWRYPALQWDVMSPYSILTDTYLTAVTVFALADFGYVVNGNAVEFPPLHSPLTKPTIGQQVFKHGDTHVHVVLPERGQ